MINTITIQETSKKLKVHILISAFIFWIGVGLMIGGVNILDTNIVIFSILIIAIGFIYYIVTKIRIWWNHK